MRERENHYSIRKLTIGVASVLIGISFFGIKADTVQAETSNSNESISQESEQTKTNANTSESAQDETITPATTEGQNADGPSNSTTSNVQEDRTDPAANRDKIGKEAPSASATFGKNSTLTIDHGQLDEKQKTAKLTMNSADFQAGDTYTITIPKKGGLSLGKTDVAVLAPVFGKTTFTETIDYYKIEDHFINGGTITQNINLHYDKNINPLASMTNTITVDTTGSAEKHASLKVIAIGKEPELSADLVHVPQPIINGQEFTTRPALTLGTPLKDFNQVNLNLALDKNYKLTNITLNDEDRSLVLTPDQLTIDANNVAHIVLNEEQITSLLKGQSNHFNFKITGHFDIPASDFVNKKYHAKFLDKDKSTISGTIVNVTTKPSHIGTITGTGVDDLTIYPTVKDIDWAATVNYLKEYTAHDKDNPGKDTSGVMVVDGKTSSTTDMHYFTLSNQSTLDITDANLTVDLPDGYNVPATLTLSENTIYQDQDQDPDNINFIVSYVDGTSAVITPDQFGNTLTFHVTPNKKIRSLNVRIAQWNPDVEYDLSSKHGTYSKTYANGQPVLVGDLLTTKTTLSSPSFNGEVMMPMTTVFDRLVNKVKEGTFTAVYPFLPNQTSTVPGEKNAGSLTYEICVSGYGHPMLKHPITYIMVPDNAEVADLSKVTVKYSGAYVDYQPLLTPKSVSVITVDGHRFVKIDCSNYDLLEDGLNVTVPYSNAPDVQNSTKPSVFFTVADNLKNGNLNEPDDHTVAQALKGLVQKEKIDTSKAVYNGSKAGYPGSWIINTVEGMSSATMVSGNTSGISTLATQDVHGINPDQMKIYGSIINATNNQIANAYQIINIPDRQDKVSQFTPTMSGQASLIDAVNGTDLSSAGELLYSTALTDLNNAQAAAADGHWLTADQITNWSKVKSVMLKFDSKALPGKTSARVEIPLVDKDIYQHVGKSISVSSAIFSENKASSNSNLPNLTILPGKPASAKLTVTGQAKVNVKVHYKDDQGNNHYVDLPDQAKTYHEGQDIMKPEDFMTKNSDLTDADRILLPAGIVINWAAGPTIQNSDAQYAAGYQNGTAAFDQTVVPDFDGDTLIYEGAFAKPVTDTHKVTRTIKFVDQNGKQIYPDVAQHSIEFTRSGFEDPFTHKIAWAEIPGSDILPQYQVPKIDGYTPDESQVAQATVKFGDPDSAITVTYKANSQVIKVNFIDDTTGETLNSKSLDGISDADANYNTKADINNYEKQHYVLVRDSSDGQDLIFDHDDQATQSYDVHFTHDTKPDSRQDTVTRTITYTGAGNKTPSAVTQSVHFTQAGTKDLVTGKTKWNDVADQNFVSVGTPEVAGYTPDKSQVAQATVKYGDKDTTVTVTYVADKQQAKLRFYDDTAKKFIDAAPVLDASGKTDAQVGFTIPNSYDFSKYNFVNVTKGADPESTDQLAGADLSAVQYGKYDTDDKKDQVFVAHFTHKIKAINEKVTVNETIHYVYEDGSKAHDDYQATPLVFTKTGTKDLVTGEEKATWTKSQKFAEVASPEIPGYTPDQAVVPAVEVAHGDNDVVRTVTYSKNIEPQEPTTPTDNPDTPTDIPDNPVTPKAPEEPQQPATPDDNLDVVRPHSDNSPQKKQDSKQTNKTTEVNKTVKRSSTVKPKATATTKRNGTKVQLATKDASKQSNPKAVVNSTSMTVVNNKGEKKAETLPQTGEKDNKLGILGLLTLSLASLFGFSEKKKKED
ncbi:mucin-binding protein [Lactobacillus crispatus]|uniref:mucin-binding protein n=1 Tax=Lactobacillus crispatus TaxID=47770 RepID=UPI00123A55A0|nr:YSIRK-type signal peptide-containing protein [Lactobacillus crispatus]KAA8782176.1 YSIRK-type signal peptide-containing protein [Lactobacillus crispatus]KAA8808360.1 YSIRK-type signal peptide-containing protein [Lactobacillus crispatus]